jgi:DNA-binding NarL/FixJ family response regulator
MADHAGSRPRAVIADDSLNLAENIAVLSDRALYRDGLVEILRKDGFRRVDGFATFARLLKAARGGVLGFTLVDLAHEEEAQGEMLARLRIMHPNMTVVAIGTPSQLAARASAVDGCVELPGDGAGRLTAMAGAVARQRHGPVKFPVSPEVARQSRTWASLTPRQRQVLGLLGCGMENLKIAASLGISERAVKAHVSGLLEKFGVGNRTGLAIISCRAGVAAV